MNPPNMEFIRARAEDMRELTRLAVELAEAGNYPRARDAFRQAENVAHYLKENLGQAEPQP